MSGADWTFRAVHSETWPDLSALFDGTGGPKSCWCMMWRKTVTGGAAHRADRRVALHGLVQSGQQIGILGYDQGIPVAWCSIAPRSNFSAGLGQDTEGLWSLTCFFIRASHRKQAGFAALLTAAESHACASGATMIEAYPVDPDSPSYRFCGFMPNFARAGYTEFGQIGARRHIMRKALRV